MSDITNFIVNYVVDKALILIPFLWVIGAIIKGIDNKIINDKFIPVILLIIGIITSIAMLGFSVDSIIQGVLVTGVSVYGNQIIKQLKKE